MGSGNQAEHREKSYNDDKAVPTYVLRHRLLTT
jgi:hypothetical protein